MTKASYGDKDAIAATATALAESALALVRTTGTNTIDLLAGAFSRPQKLLSAGGNSIVHGWIVDPDTNEKIDEVMLSVFRAPRSFSGEDGAEISCHGGIATVKAVMAALKKAGFREALPGEFTFRAFMNGKLDLTRAESVMELVSAKTNRGREQAVRRLTGRLEKEISEIKTMLMEVLAAAEIYLDYSEDEFLDPENDEEAGRLPSRDLAVEAERKLTVLADLWRQERIYAEGALAVFAGKPNAGKSSLFNYLIREDRSIVTDTPGTTRDWIETLVSIEEIPIRLADTAGLRDLSGTDEAERLGMQRSLELLGKADLILYVVDGSLGVTEEDKKFILEQKKANPVKPLIVLWNKTDIAPPPISEQTSLLDQSVAVSAKTGEGVNRLLDSIVEVLKNASLQGRPEIAGQNVAGPGTLRQKELIDASLASLGEALALAQRGEPLDLVAPLLRSSIDALGEITGEVSNSDILELMFSRFCVGK